jgi:hypothetical protein
MCVAAKPSKPKTSKNIPTLTNGIIVIITTTEMSLASYPKAQRPKGLVLGLEAI